MDGLYKITLPYACCGLVVAGGRVIDAAPIVGWMVGRTLATVMLWIRKKQGRIEWIAK